MEDMFLFSPVLINKFKSMNQRYLDSRLKGFDIPSKSGVYIMLLYKQGELTQNQICKILGFDKAHTSRILKGLETGGLVQKFSDKKDSRKNLFQLTQSGKDLACNINEVMSEWQKILFLDFSKEEVENFKKYINKMVNSTERYIKENKK